MERGGAERPYPEAAAPGPSPGGQAGAGLSGRPYAWLAAIAAAVLLVRWAGSAGLLHAGAAERALAVAGLFAGSGVLAAAPGVALISVAARRRQTGPATALGLLLAGSSTVAMAGFWAWYASPSAGRAADAAFLVVSFAVTAVFGRRGDLGRVDLAVPLALALGAGLVFTGLAFFQGGVAAVRPLPALAARFWLEGDNQSALMFAQRVAAHHSLSGYLSPTWLYSDRPPLQAGFDLLQWPLWGHDQELPYQLLGTCLQLAWLPALWTLLRVRGLGAPRAGAAVLATAATGAVFFNSVYVWPKMLSAALALAAFAILASRDPDDRRPGIGVLTTALCALAMLAHGGAAFALIALLPFAWRLRRRLTARSVAACAAAAVMLYAPWMMFQRFVDPPGNRLEKWQLAGVIGIDSRGVLQTLVQQYRRLSPGQLFAYKITDNLAALTGNHGLLSAQSVDEVWLHQGFMGYARLSQFFDLLPASVPLVLGVFALLFPSGRRALAAVKPLAVFAALTLAAWMVLLWGGPAVPTIIHEGPYALLVLFIGLCAVAATALPRPLAVLVLAADAAWFAVCWVPGLGFQPGSGKPGAHLPVDSAMVAVCGAGLVILAAAGACAHAPARRRLLAVAWPRGSAD
ncbi:MAG TPA: hypothetical protein VFO01_17060 [Trebonia sp.]|nr:hypothetical protein [Trebonia sp.]